MKDSYTVSSWFPPVIFVDIPVVVVESEIFDYEVFRAVFVIQLSAWDDKAVALISLTVVNLLCTSRAGVWILL